VILSVDDAAISRRVSLATLIDAHKPGDTVTLSVMTTPSRAGQSPTPLKVTLGNAGGKPYLGVQYTTLTEYRPLMPGLAGQGYDRFYPFTPPSGSGSLPSSRGSGLSVPQGGLSF
jgi:hypothetical protein